MAHRSRGGSRAPSDVREHALGVLDDPLEPVLELIEEALGRVLVIQARPLRPKHSASEPDLDDIAHLEIVGLCCVGVGDRGRVEASLPDGGVDLRQDLPDEITRND